MNRSISATSVFVEFFRSLPFLMQQPAGIAFFGSTIAHMLFFASLPAFTPAEDSQADLSRKVKMITLSPEDEGRLPSIGGSMPVFGAGMQPGPNSQMPLPFGNQTTTLTPASPLPFYNIPGLDSTTPNFSSSTSGLKSLDETTRRKQNDDFNAILKALESNNRIAVKPNTEPKKEEKSTPAVKEKPLEFSPPKEELPKEELSALLERYKLPELAAANPSPSPVPAGSTPMPPGGQTQPTPTGTGQPTPTGTGQPTPTATGQPTPTASSTEEQKRQLEAQRQQEEARKRQIALRAQFLQDISFVATNTELDSGDNKTSDTQSSGTQIKAPTKNWYNWYAKFSEAVTNKEMDEVKHPVVQDPAKDSPILFLQSPDLVSKIPNFKSHPILIGVKIDPDGKMEGPIVFGSSGYGLLNKDAIDFVRKQLKDLPNPQKPTIHKFQLQYKAPEQKA